MLSWYRRLLRLRKEAPAITQGLILSQEAGDGSGLIFLLAIVAVACIGGVYAFSVRRASAGAQSSEDAR